MAAETDCPITSPLSRHAQTITKCVRTTKQQQAAQQCATSGPLSWPPQVTPPAAMTILAGDCETGSLHPGADGRGFKQLNTGKTVSSVLNQLNQIVDLLTHLMPCPHTGILPAWAVHVVINTSYMFETKVNR